MVSSQHSYDPSDARTRVALLTEQNAKSLWLEQKKQEIREKNAGDAGAAAAQLQALQNGVNGGGGGRGEGSTFELMMYVGGFLALISAVMLGSVWALVRYLDSVA